MTLFLHPLLDEEKGAWYMPSPEALQGPNSGHLNMLASNNSCFLLTTLLISK